MKNIGYKNITCFLLISFLTTSFINGQTADPKGNVIRSATSIEEDIQYLQNRIPDLLKKLNLEDKNEIIFNVAPKHGIGNKVRYVIVEKVIITLSGNNLSQIIFVYDKSNEDSLFREVRELTNKSPSESNCDGLILRYRTSKGDKDEFNYNSIEQTELKFKVLRVYRDSLNDFVRWLDFYGGKNTYIQQKKVKKALSVGSV